MTNLKPVDESSIATDSSQLIMGCRHCLDQCEELLSLISAEHYIEISVDGSSIGAHMRHILDRFQCFFLGLQDGCVDYDARKRDKSIESDLAVANSALSSIVRRVEGLGLEDREVSVRAPVHAQGPSVTVPSTVDRELMGLVTHSVHHLAVLALVVRSFGYQLDRDFGKAPSTILYERA